MTRVLKSGVPSIFNAFCPTGQGGGIDPSCSPDGGGGGGNEATFMLSKRARKIIEEGGKSKPLHETGEEGFKNDSRREAAVAGAKVKYTAHEVRRIKDGVHYVRFQPGANAKMVVVMGVKNGRAEVRIWGEGPRTTKLNELATLQLIHGMYRSPRDLESK